MALITHQVLQKPIEQRLIDAACIFWDVDRNYFRAGGTKEDERAHRRYIVFYLIKTNTILSFKAIGRMFGFPNHSLVQNGIDFVEAQKSVNRQVSGAINQITLIASNLDAEFITIDVRLETKKPLYGDIH